MDIQTLFPPEKINLPENQNLIYGKIENDEILGNFEKFSYIEFENNQIIIHLWNNYCISLFCCCCNCFNCFYNYKFIEKLPPFLKFFYFYKKLIIKKDDIVDIGYFFSGFMINENWKYYPILALNNKKLIIIGKADEKYELIDYINNLRNKLNINNKEIYEIPYIYKSNIL